MKENLSSISKLVRLLRIKLSQPRILLGIILLGILTYLIIVPAITLIITSSTFQLMDVMMLGGVKEGEFTLYHWKSVLNNYAVFIQPFLNTLVIAIGTAGFTAVVGVLLAWLVSRTDIPLKGLLAILAMIPYLLPSWALALPWIEIFQNTGVNMPMGFLESIAGLRAPLWLVFGPVPVIIVLGLHYFPFSFLLVGSALKNINSELEETAELLGAGRLKILRTITLPVVLPSLLSALILTFSLAIGSFGTPSLLGLPAKFNVLSVQIRSLMFNNRNGEAYVLAIMLVALCTVIIYLNNRVIGTRRGFEIIGGKGVRQRLTSLGKYRIPVSVSIIVFLSITVLLPMALLFWTSFMLNDGDYSIGNLSFYYWFGVVNPKDVGHTTGDPGVFRNPMFFISLKNTLLISGLGAVMLGVLGMLVGYVVVVGRGKQLSSLLERISFVPIMIPSIAFAATYIALFGISRGPIPALYGTLAILILVVIGKQMPYASRAGISAMYQPSKELEEAGEVLGAGWLQRFRQLVWPLTKSGFSAGFLIVFITTSRDLSLFILLVTSKTQVLTTLIFDYAQVGARQLSYAIMTVLVTLTLIVTGLYRVCEKYSKKSLVKKGIL